MAITQSTSARPVRTGGGRLSVGLLGGFQLSLGQGLLAPVSGASQRLLAFLALRQRPLSRTLVAETLWPDTSDARAHASLRSALAPCQAGTPRYRHDVFRIGLPTVSRSTFETAGRPRRLLCRARS